MPSQLAAQMVDDDWATQILTYSPFQSSNRNSDTSCSRPKQYSPQFFPMCTELTVIAEEGQVTGTETAVIQVCSLGNWLTLTVLPSGCSLADMYHLQGL